MRLTRGFRVERSESGHAFVIVRLEGEISVVDIPDQQALALTVPADAHAEALHKRFQFHVCRCLDALEA